MHAISSATPVAHALGRSADTGAPTSTDALTGTDALAALDAGPAPAPARGARRRLTSVAAAALLAIAGLFAGASPALAHDEMVGFGVEVDVNDGSATAITLQFNNEIMDIGTEFLVTGPDGENVVDGAATVAGRSVTQAITWPLAEGEYEVAWRVVSSDGHPIQGVLSLAIAADGTGVLSPANADGAAEEHEHEQEHEHDDATAADDGETVHTQGADEDGAGMSPLVTTLIVVVVALAAAGAVAAVAIGSKRRARAFGEAGDTSADTGADTDADTDSSTGSGTATDEPGAQR